MERVTTVAALRQQIAAARAAGATIGLVPTMGALHAGHLALVRLAAANADMVVVSIFVNPTQFDRDDDLAAYPRDLDGDLAALETLGTRAPAVVYTPTAEQMYPREPRTQVRVATLTDHLCGATRPGHFDGVATVVTKLLNQVRPDLAVFGRKDRQQLAVIRRLVTDLDLDVEVMPGPTVREPDGLALSSRNRRLAAAARREARRLSRALRAAVVTSRSARDRDGPLAAEDLLAAGHAELSSPAVEVEYLEVVDPEELQPRTGPIQPGERVVLAVAAVVDGVRLIDNVEVGDRADEDGLLAAGGGE